MATKLLPEHFGALLPGVIGYMCRCGADDWALVQVKSRPSPEGYVRLRCKECARDAATDQFNLSDNVKDKRYNRYYGRMVESYALQVRRWVAILEASIASGEFDALARYPHLLDCCTDALAKPIDMLSLEHSAHTLQQAMTRASLGYVTAAACDYTGPLPWQDVVASAFVLNADTRYASNGPDDISYEGVWDPSTKRLRPFQTPSWMPTPATFTNHSTRSK